jgi:hypothetical protein
MGKNQSASGLINIVQYDTAGNISLVSGSTTLLYISSSGAITTTGVISGSNALSASYSISASNALAAQTASFVQNAQSASYVLTAQTASFVANAQSASNAVAAQTASYANNLTVAGTLTAQTLVVQTITSSVDFVTGSTRFGSILGNTHVFSGSVTMNPGGLFVSSSGVVGIGTTSPVYKLMAVPTPNSNSFDGIMVSTGVADVVGILRTGSSYSYGMVGANQSWIYSNFGDLNIVSDAGSIKFGTTSGTERMRITSGGNLQLTNANPTIDFVTNTTTTTTMFSIVGAQYVGSAPFNANILRANNSSHITFETGGSERMRITSGGNLLVGTTNDTGYKLSVKGGTPTSIKFTDDETYTSYQRSYYVQFTNYYDISTEKTDGGSYEVLLLISSVLVASGANFNTYTFALGGRGTNCSATQLHNQSGGTASRSAISISFPSNGVIRLTLTGGETCNVKITMLALNGV